MGSEERKLTIKDRRRRDLWFRRVLITWVIVFTIAVGWSIRKERENTDKLANNTQNVAALVKQNKERITDIQQSRVESCKSIYESFHAVFDPFFPPPRQRTQKQKDDFKKFNKIIAGRVAKCKQLVIVKPDPKGAKK